MTVKNGEIADETTFNTSFISREEDSGTVAKIALEDPDSDSIPDAQAAINTNKTNITANTDNITTNTMGIATNVTGISDNETAIQTINDSIGQPDGIASLDNTGKVPSTQLPTAGALQFQGTWDAATNTPDLLTATKENGFYWVVNVAGSTDLDGITDWNINDWAIYNGSEFQKIDNSESVVSVNSQQGVVVLDADNIEPTLTRKYDSVIHNRNASVNPTVTNDDTESYGIGSTWFNSVEDKKFIAKSVATGAAQWIEASGSGSGIGSPYTYNVETFEEVDAGAFSVTGSATIGNDTVNPLFGARSIRINHVIGGQGSIITFDNPTLLQQGQQNTLNAIRVAVFSDTTNADAVYRLIVSESPDDVTYVDNASTLDFTANEMTEVVSVLFTPSQSTEFIKLKIEIVQETTQASERLIFDNIEFVTNPLQTIEFDNVTDQEAYSPILSSSGGGVINLNSTGPTQPNGTWGRVADKMKVYASFRNGSSGVATGNAGAVLLSIPSGYQIDFAKLSANVGGILNVGQGSFFSPEDRLIVTAINSTQVRFTKTNGNLLNLVDLTASDVLSCEFEVPIVGWSATGSGVVGHVKTEITTGQEYETGEIIDNKKVYGYVFKVNSDVTANAVLVSNPVGIVDPVFCSNYFNTFWKIEIISNSSSSENFIYYDRSSGNIAFFQSGSYKIGAGTILRFKYTK